MYREIMRIEFEVATDIEEACIEACKIARRRDVIVEFDFNGKLLKACAFTSAKSLVDEYHGKLEVQKADE